MNKIRFMAVILLVVRSRAELLTAQSHLIIRGRNGDQSVSLLSEVSKLTFPVNGMTVTKTNTSTQSFSLSDLRYLAFKDNSNGIGESSFAIGIPIRIFPVPASDILQVDYKGNSPGSGNGEILDMQGRVLKSFHLDEKMSLDISHLQAGIYIFRIQYPEGSYFIKFIKK